MFDVYSYERFNDLVGDTLVATVMNEQEAEQLLKQHNCYDYAESESVILRKYNGKIFREEKEAGTMNELKKYILNHWPSENLESEIIYAYDKMDALDKALDCEGHIYELIEAGGVNYA